MFQRAVVRGFLATAIMGCAVVAQAITIDTVVVGNAGNTVDSTGYGAVSYAYNIGKYEVTAKQYTAFLNAVAATDTYALYNTDSNWITRSGSSGSYTYTVDSSFNNRPVNHVSWYDTLRFANWMTNGQGAGDTETGAYTITSGGENSGTISTMPDHATLAAGSKTYWLLPSEDEWYKASYYKGGSTDAGYNLYPTGSTVTGTTGGTTAGTAVFYDPANNISPSGLADVDNAGGLSAYGTMGQGGNVWERNEALIDDYRGSRGGYYFGDSSYLAASWRSSVNPTWEGYTLGFRVASVPEPGSLAMLLGIALTALLYYWRKHV